MKKSIYTFGLFLAIGLTSCSGSIEDAASGLEELAEDMKEEATSEPTMVGDWKLSDFDLGQEIPAEQAEMFEAMKQEMIANSTMSYKADGTYSQSDMMQGQATTKTGTYSVEGDQLTTTSEDGITTTVKIASLTETEASFSMEERGNTMTMTYTRQ